MTFRIKIEEVKSIPIDTFNSARCGRRKVIRRVSKKPSDSEDPNGVIAKTVMKYLGIPGDKEFTPLMEADKEEVGCRLEVLLREVTEGALVPLMNSLLSRGEVEKLACLKGIPIDTFDNANILDDSVKKEEPSDDSDFENITNQSSKTQETVEREDDSDSDSSSIISDEEECAEVAKSLMSSTSGRANQSYVRRKKIDFSVRDLESGADDDSGSDREWTAGHAEAARSRGGQASEGGAAAPAGEKGRIHI